MAARVKADPVVTALGTDFSAQLSLRMSSVVNLDQSFHRDMSVNLRGRESCMAQQLLNVAQVSAAVEQMRGERMAQRVWTYVVNPDAEPNVLFNQPAD